MANLVQLKQLEELDGLLLVDKPAGIAFSSVVKAVKRKFNLPKVGHGGSLEAMASGLFILLINDANRFVDQVMGADRVFEGALDCSYATDTGDCHGRRLTNVAQPTEGLPRVEDFKGDVFQTEPRFAAIRKEGSAEYEVVDTGDHSQFLSHVYRLDLSPTATAHQFTFTLKCSKNFLPRAMAVEMGASLTALRRTAIGRFGVADAVPFERLLETEVKDFASLVMPLSQALV